jgi:hypothetical protein
VDSFSKRCIEELEVRNAMERGWWNSALDREMIAADH